MEILDNQKSGNLLPPQKSSVVDLLIKAHPDHPIAKKYLEEKNAYDEKLQRHFVELPKKPQPELPPLEPIDVDSFYNAFLDGYRFFQGKEFNSQANQCEPRKLARTIAAYLIGKKAFVQSPLLNHKSTPSLDKGLLIIGDYGTGKTSVIETFHKILFLANSNPLTVQDVHGNDQLLGRYMLSFGYYTANDVVKSYEAINDPAEKEYFWKKHKHGMKYYDDVMTESTASNFGKIEIFKDILEMRYTTSAKTLISMNYSGNSIDDTLQEVIRKYGPRVYDRIFEMFNIIELRGDSLRK